ncbi:SHOCT domain-containing protein [Patescibacteria group bacterium]|nr:SHOCT domain-containing protein [Patescibacteria group bacterium]
MKKALFTILALLLLLFAAPPIFAQSPSPQDRSDINKGKEIYQNLLESKISCDKLKDDDFEKIGEYFMEQRIGNSNAHANMNDMMKNMMGENGEIRMHISLGKRYSNCDSNAPVPQKGYQFLPMLGMMNRNSDNGNWRGGGNPMMGFGWNNMMGFGGFGLGWISMLLFWILIVLAIVALLRYLGSFKNTNDNKTSLDILKERYARGEIDKKEYQEKKKELD